VAILKFKDEQVLLCCIAILGYKRNWFIRNRKEIRKWEIVKNNNRNKTRNNKFYESITETGTKNGTRKFRPKCVVQPGASWFDQ
jgi:hypothetical protein